MDLTVLFCFCGGLRVVTDQVYLYLIFLPENDAAMIENSNLLPKNVFPCTNHK